MAGRTRDLRSIAVAAGANRAALVYAYRADERRYGSVDRVALRLLDPGF